MIFLIKFFYLKFKTINVDSEDNNLPFHLQCRPMSGLDNFLHDNNIQYTIRMVKYLPTDRFSLREDHLRLLFNGDVLEDNRSLRKISSIIT